MFSPTQNIFIVKSTGAYFAVYSLDTMSLIKKVKYSNVDGGQDDGYCFSMDGTYFYNIERQGSSINSAISIYDTTTFIAKCNENGLKDIFTVSQEDYDYYNDFKSLEIGGFTEKAKEWSGFKYKNVDMTGMGNIS